MFILLLLFWLLLMNDLTIEIVVFGVILSLAIYLLMHRLFGITPKKEMEKICLLWYAPAFIFLIIFEVVKANISTLKVVFCKKKPKKSVIVKKTFPLVTGFARTVLANSITLTPGTISVLTDGGTFTIHSLTPEFADGIEAWVVVRFLRHIERRLGYDA